MKKERKKQEIFTNNAFLKISKAIFFKTRKENSRKIVTLLLYINNNTYISTKKEIHNIFKNSSTPKEE